MERRNTRVQFCKDALIIRWFFSLLRQQTGAYQGLGHSIGVTVGGWTAVLKVALLLLANRAGDADAGTAVGHASRELVHGAGLVQAGQTPAVVLSTVRVVFDNMPAKSSYFNAMINDKCWLFMGD